MRIAVLSDIHANLPALDAVLAELRREHLDRVLIAGDLVSGCPYARETWERLRALQADGPPVSIIRGNNDNYLLSMHRGDCPPGFYTSRQWGLIRWAWEQLGTEGSEWLAGLPARLSLDHPGGGLLLLHGSPRRENEGLVPDRDPAVLQIFFRARLLDPAQTNIPLGETLERIDEGVLVCGHTHVPWRQFEGRKLALNPGAVGCPINGDNRAQYAVLESDERGHRVEFRTVPYDIAEVQAAFESSGLLEAGGGFARACRLDLERADNTVWKFVLHCYEYARSRGAPDGPVLPEDLWCEAEAIYPFD